MNVPEFYLNDGGRTNGWYCYVDKVTISLFIFVAYWINAASWSNAALILHSRKEAWMKQKYFVGHFSSTLHVCLFFIAAFVLSAGTLQAKDLRNRFGLGLDNQLTLSGMAASSPASFSVKYTLPSQDKTINTQVEILAGLSLIENQPASVTLGGRFLYTAIAEDNANVFVGLGGAWLQGSNLEYSSPVLRIQPISGVEFFLFGLENLGFTTAIGLNIDLFSPVSIGTTGSTTANLGIHYYF